MHFRKHTLLLLVLTCFLYSCSNDTDELTSGNDQINSDDSIENDDINSDEEVTLVQKITYIYPNNQIAESHLEYLGNKLVLVKDGNFRDEVKYIYDNELLKKIEYPNSNSFVALEYAEDNRLAFFTEVIDQVATRFKVIYNSSIKLSVTNLNSGMISSVNLDASQNIIHISNTDNSSITCTYDERSGAFNNVHGIAILNLIWHFTEYAGISSDHNNITSWSQSFLGTEIISDAYEYTYNSNGYPTIGVYTIENFIGRIEYTY